MRVNKTKEVNHQNAFFSWVLQGLFTSIFISLLAVFVVSMYTFFTDAALDDGKLKIIFTVTMLSSIFFGSLLAAHSLKKNGLLLGVLVGGIYVALMISINHSIHVNIGFEAMSVVKVAICMGAGALGGVLGVNL